MIVTLAAFGVNSALVLLFGLIGRVAPREVVGTLVGTVVINAVILAALFYKRDDFRATETGEHLRRVNFANILTILRISAVPTLLFFVVHGRQRLFAVASIVLAAIVFLTDLFDGLISRRAHQQTVIGVYLDSSGDYAILAASAIALRAFELIPAWFFFAVLGRLGLQVVFVILEVAVIGSARQGTNIIGKASVFAMMTAFALALANPAWDSPALEQSSRYMEYATGAILAVSAVDKVRLFVTRLSEHRRHRYSPD